MSKKCGCKIVCACRHMVDKRDDPRIEFCDLHARAERTKRERDALMKAAWDARDIYRWMTGSPDFAPEGMAGEGWAKFQETRDRIDAAIAACGEWDR